MTRNLKALGLALIAVCAMSGLAASAAQAEFTFTGWEGTESNHVHTILSGSQTTAFGDKFRVTTGKLALECEKATASGTLTVGDQATVTATPAFTNCKGGGAPVTVNTTTCDYVFHITAKVTADEYKGTVDVKCTTPKDTIHVSVYTDASHTSTVCEYTIEEQEGISGITYTNITPEKGLKYVEIDIAAHNIKTEVTKGGILCGESTGVTATESVFEGSDKVTGVNTLGEPVNVTVSG